MKRLFLNVNLKYESELLTFGKKGGFIQKKLMSSSTLVLIDVGESSNPKEVIERGAMMMSNRRTYIRAIHLIQMEFSTTKKSDK